VANMLQFEPAPHRSGDHRVEHEGDYRCRISFISPGFFKGPVSKLGVNHGLAI
jgi:hypothetical protein